MNIREAHRTLNSEQPHTQAVVITLGDYDTDFISPVIGGRQGYYLAKRILDFLGALVLLITLLPLFVVISFAILIYSPGPILYRQERVGAKRKHDGNSPYWEKINFTCYKFRTMKVNADSAIHRTYVQALITNDQEKMASVQGEKTETGKLLHDKRITKPGALLRKSSLDELPQLWNVLRGDMSLVGPRPAIAYEVDVYQPWHRNRLAAQPGITGLQQVTARCTADFDQQVKLDLEYIKKQSFWLDLRIILRTPFAILSAKGAH